MVLLKVPASITTLIIPFISIFSFFFLFENFLVFFFLYYLFTCLRLMPNSISRLTPLLIRPKCIKTSFRLLKTLNMRVFVIAKGMGKPHILINLAMNSMGFILAPCTYSLALDPSSQSHFHNKDDFIRSL